MRHDRDTGMDGRKERMIEMAAKKKLFLIAGHGEGDPGACSIWGQEANYTRELAKLVKTAIGSRMRVTLYDTNKKLLCTEQERQRPGLL